MTLSIAQMAREALLGNLKCRAITHGDFTLASGKKSTYYLDCRKALLHGPAALALGEALYHHLYPRTFNAIGGLETGAIAVATAAVTVFALHDKPLNGFYVRKAPKEHGSRSLVEGALQPGDHAVVVDDVFTSGRSVLKAIEAVKKAGATVAAVVCVVDRLEGARELLEGEKRYTYLPLFTIRDLGIESAAAAGGEHEVPG